MSYASWLALPRLDAARLDRRFTVVARLALLYWIAQYVLLDGWRFVRTRGVGGAGKALYGRVKNLVVRILLSLPSSRKQIHTELAKARSDLVSKLAPSVYPNGIVLSATRTVPDKGKDRAWLEEEWRNLKLLERGDVDSGRVSGTVYHGGEDLAAITSEAMARFLVSNPLHPDVFPGVRKMESDVVSMCLNLFNGLKGAGTTTSGGTESILMACKTYRDWARKTKGISRPEMIIPSSAHAAFWKASQYFCIKLHVIPVDNETRKADVKRMKRAINPNTIMLVGSAPNFPDGIIDPIPALAALAKSYNIGLHVDCCLGSFLMPFLGRAGLGEGVEAFDFSVPGVTSISCDTHKYGFCPKGSSVIMYHSPELRRHQYYVMTDWAGGVYASPSMAGSRPGSVLAGAWAVINHIGQDGYTESCKQIVSAARHFTEQLRTRFAADLRVLGEPRVSVVAFASRGPDLNVHAVGDEMGRRGWHLSGLSNPAGLHMAFTRLSAGSVSALLDDLELAIQAVRERASAAGGVGKEGDMVALYGLGQTSVGPHVVGKLAETFLDVLYE